MFSMMHIHFALLFLVVPYNISQILKKMHNNIKISIQHRNGNIKVGTKIAVA